MNSFIKFIFTLFCVSAASIQLSAQGIVPKPVSIDEGKNEYRIPESLKISVEDKSLDITRDVFIQDMQNILDVNASDKKADIILSLNPKLENEEYVLSVDRRKILIEGGNRSGVHYGLQTLKQLLVNKRIPCQIIKDKPFFEYRGTMLDVSRHFFTVDEVKSFIDILSLHKMNKMHWHLTDDPGWRIEIKKYPKLTEIGSWRKETIVGFHKTSNTFDGIPHSGYYTQDEIKDIVKYASDRCVEIIPEIELPGHSIAALASYPWLGCTEGPYEVITKWGVYDDIYCVGKESTFEFLQNVLSEIIELFPSKYIHIGGDECPKAKWKKCPDCQRRMKELGLKKVDELQGYFTRRIEKWLLQHDRKIIGWDETLYCGVSENTTIMSWRDAKHGIEAAKKGNHVIMTPVKNCYLDYYQTADPEKNHEKLAFPRYLPVQQVYRLEPFDQLTPEQQSYVIGVQGCVWTEFIADFEHVEWMMLPRLAALSETAWAYDRKNYKDFENRMPTMRLLYEKYHYNYAPFMFEGIE